MSGLRSIFGKLWPRSNIKKAVILLIIIILAGSGGLITVSEQTWFCNSCHIMNPYYASWQASGHSEVNCLECHIDPGFAGIVRAKLNGIAQAVDYSLARNSTKPNALVGDASCLRDGCHTTESLSAEPVTFIDDRYKFSHQGHIGATVSGLPLLCTTCHSHFEGEEHFKVSTQVCFICHFSKADTGVDVRLVDTRCWDCHDAPAGSFRRGNAEIDHSKFIIAQLDCEQMCHNRQVDPNTHVKDVQCLDCHGFRNQGQYNAKDLHIPHSGKDKVECLACHEMINHSASPIEKHHTSLKCDKCHQVPFEAARLAEIEFIKMPGDCSLCHNDPHSGQFKKTCQQCHSEHGWTGRWVIDAHGQEANFPLVGKHRSVECARCHVGSKLAQARFTGLPHTCEQCHHGPHSGQFTKECTTCHSEQGWTGQLLLFTHKKHSEFRLDSIHADLSCSSCHEAGGARIYRPLPRTCESCHTDIVRQQSAEQAGTINPHAGRVSCVQCHSPDLKHQTPAEYAEACRTCHNPRYQELFYDWTKSLNDREFRAKMILERMREQNAPGAQALEQKIKRAKSAGFHNLAIAIKLWDDILDDGFDDDTQK